MANQPTSSEEGRSFDKSLIEDVNDFHLPKNVWTQARNAINNSKSGDLGKLGNEPGTLFCTRMPYTVIGAIHLQADMWLMFSTNNTDSEIGIFTRDLCNYELLVNDRCLGFNTRDLIIGTSKPTGDCTIDAYWDDSRNPTRFIRVNIHLPHNLYVPYVCADVDPSPDCIDCQPIIPLQLDCEKIRLAPLVKPPCFRVEKGVNGGTLLNGSYFVVAAYTINQLKVTDYYTPSNVQSLFSHENVAGSLDIFAEFTDDRFDEYELVIISTINQQTVARRVGIYSTRQAKITLDMISNTWTTVPIEQISLLNPVVERADAMFSVQDYLLRVGPYNRLDFNYQPFANQVVVKWQSVEYKSDYYKQGGHNTGYLRDEVYPLFIRWVYTTGDKSASYHIPGRAPVLTDLGAPGPDALPGELYTWQAQNTAHNVTSPGTIAPDGIGVVLKEGYMGYWESTELYPDNKPQIWNSTTNSFLNFGPGKDYNLLLPPYIGTNILDYDLCGKPIRHHKMPDNDVLGFSETHHFDAGGDHIRILGLAFENIKPPLDNEGNLIPGIVGYEILRGSRQGNRSIIAKGVINNMGNYTIQGATTTRKGAYANYPYNDINPDPFLHTGTTQTVTPVCNIFGENGGPVIVAKQSDFSDKLFSFHSPDTNFTHPFLSVKELKCYGKYQGNPLGKFDFSEKHPREKVVSNAAFLTSLVAGLGIAYLAMLGKATMKFTAPQPGAPSAILAVGTGVSPSVPAIALGYINVAAMAASDLVGISQYAGGFNFGAMLGLTGGQTIASLRGIANTVMGMITGPLGGARAAYAETSKEDGQFTVLPPGLQTLVGVPTFLYYLSEGTDATLRLIKNILKYRDFALKYNSHCFYDNFSFESNMSRRRTITNSNYIGSTIQDFGDIASGYRINNQFRSDFVAVEVSPFIPINNTDTSRRDTQISGPVSIAAGNTRIDEAGNTWLDPTKYEFETNSTCAYVGLKQRIVNQYGQLNSILQMPVTTCVEYLDSKAVTITPNESIFPVNTSSPVMFNGDIYIGRYTEKNTFFYFYEWLFDQPDGYEFDYLKHRMLLFPTYWVNFETYETQDFVSGVIADIQSFSFNPTAWETTLPSSFYVLDGYSCPGPMQFAVKNAWFYLFNSGIRDFFVESEINIDLRDWGNSDSEKHYPILDRKTIFDTSIIKSRNYYKYDQSLSVSKTYINYISWGSLQQTFYDPYLAETCYQHEPKRVIYSLPAQLEAKKDYWRIFLPLNYKDFTAQVTCIKPINKNGALILFDTASPVQFQGTDQLQTGLGTKLTIGDGKLFEQPMQNLVNADNPYEYASCQDRLSVINTPTGAYWISQNQGKIYQMGNGLKEVSTDDLKWWFATYLPYKLTEDFPDFDLLDNPVSGIGCQSIYDNENSLIYFCKKDYVLRKDILDVVTYDLTKQTFIINGIFAIETGDPRYFEDASWTISYDPKTGGFTGWHDWHPDLLLPGKNTFMSISKTGVDPVNPLNIRTNGIWIHNERCDLYCNYYGKDYPFEVEWMVNTVQTVNTLRSIEYIMEMYKYAPNCYDRYHVLNENFNEAIVYNTEQCSGLLKLDLSPRNDLPLLLQYPIVNFTNIQILYSKVENKYRFNMFWDITRERGGQDVGIPGVLAYAQQTIWNTPANGYAKVLNANNMNYSKNELQRKKFRHYTNTVLLRKLVSGDRKILVLLADNKNLNSPR